MTGVNMNSASPFIMAELFAADISKTRCAYGSDLISYIFIIKVREKK